LTISTEAIKTSVFDGNGSTTAYGFSFKCYSGADLEVVLTSTAGVETVQTITTHYTVALNSNQDSSPGGTVTMVTAPASGSPAEKLVIYNKLAYTQGVDLVSGGAFNANVIEDAIDRNTILSRRANEQVTRSIQIPISDDAGTGVNLPTETLRASKAVVFDSSGNVGVSTDDYEDQVATVAASAAAASVSASAASTSASASATSASASSTSASASATSAAAAATSYDNFDDRYLGTKSSDPTLDNDGDALVDGALYFNTTDNVLMVYDLGGTTWNRTTPTSADQTKINTVSGIASDVTAVAAKATEIGRLGTADAVADMAILGTADVVTDMNVLATADVVTDMNTLATADVVTDMNVLATADVVTDMNTLGTADVVADMNTLGTADVVADMNTLATADVVADMNTLATADVVADMNTLGTADVVADMNTLGTADVVADMNTLGTADVVADMNTLATADVVADMNTLGTADVVTDMNTLGTAGNVTAMATCATNIAGVNSFAERYRVASSAPVSDLDEGDLYFNTTDNSIYYYNGSAWTAIVTYTHPTGAGNEHLPSAISQTEAGYLNGVNSDIQTQIDAKVTKTSATGSAALPAGTTVQRDGTPSAGYLRWNTTDTSAEVYDGSGWAAVGGGNTTTEGLYEHAHTISANYVITTNNNALTAGPITIDTGVSVTVPTGSTWVIA